MIHHSSKRVNRVKPWILILGIVVVIGLDLGFTTLISTPHPPTLAVDTTNKPRVNLPEILPPTVSDSVEPPVAKDDVDSNAAPPAERRRAISDRSAVFAPRRYIEKDMAQIEPAIFKPRVILIPRAQPLKLQTQTANWPAPSPSQGSYYVKASEGPETRSIEARTMRMTKESKRDRSLLAKAFPVIKKPWQWIKAVASKFR